MIWGEVVGFALVMAAGQFAPGPDMLLLTRTALADGKMAGCAMAVGIASGLVVHASLAAFGMAFLLKQHRGLESTMKGLAAGYLLWLAVMIWRSSYSDAEEFFKKGKQRAHSLFNYWTKGLMCNLLNVKVLVFLSTVMLPFLQGQHPSYWPWLLVAIVVGEGMLLWCVWVGLLNVTMVRKLYRRCWRWVDRVFSFTLVILAGVLITSLGS